MYEKSSGYGPALGYTQAGNALGSAVQTKQQPQLESLYEQLQVISKRQNDVLQRLLGLGDRLMGQRPEVATTNGCEPPSSSLIGRISDAVRQIQRQADTLSSELERLESLG